MIACHSWTHRTEVTGSGWRRLFGGRSRIQELGPTMLAAEIPLFSIPFARDGSFRINRHPTNRVHFQARGRSILYDGENGKIERRSSVIHNDQTFRNYKVRRADRATANVTAIKSLAVKISKTTWNLNKF